MRKAMGQEKKGRVQEKRTLRKIMEFRLSGGQKTQVRRGRTDTFSHACQHELRLAVFEGEEFSREKPQYLVRVKNQEEQEREKKLRIASVNLSSADYFDFFAFLVYLDAQGKLEKSFFNSDFLNVGSMLVPADLEEFHKKEDFFAKLGQCMTLVQVSGGQQEPAGLLKLYQACLKYYAGSKEATKNQKERRQMKEELRRLEEAIEAGEGIHDFVLGGSEEKEKAPEDNLLEKKRIEGGNRYLWNRAMEQYGFVVD